MNQPRVAPGVPTGGQFAPGAKPRSAVTLADVAEVNGEAARSSGLLDGFVDAVGGPAPLDSPECASEAVRLRLAEGMLGRTINASRTSAECRISNGPDDFQVSHQAGLEFGYTMVAASLLQPHDEDAAGKLGVSIQMAMHRGAANTDADRSKILADVADLTAAGGVTDETAGRQMRLMLAAAVTTLQEAAPEVPGSDKSPHQWNQQGMSRAFAEGAAVWASPTGGGNTHTGKAEEISRAMAAGVTDIDELAEVARGHRFEDSQGNWISYSEGWDDADYAEGG